jgi:hypothetical protein
MTINIEALVNEVAKRTKGTKSDPLTRDEVENVVRHTLDVMDEQSGDTTDDKKEQ